MSHTFTLSDVRTQALLDLMGRASGELMHNGCNDYPVAVTPANANQVRNLLLRMHAGEEQEEPGFVDAMLQTGLARGTIVLTDWLVLRTLIADLRHTVGSLDDRARHG